MDMFMKVYLYFLCFVVVMTACTEAPRVISLQDTWAFQLDSADVGQSEQWFLKSLPETIHLPGAMRDEGKGYDPSLAMHWTGSIYDSSWYFAPRLAKYRTPAHLKFPFWLTPVKHYLGPAWYQHTVHIPASWQHRRVVLYLERPHWQTTVWVDSTVVGKQNSLVAPHVYDLTQYITPGTHRLTLRIDNRLIDVNVGPDSHSITDHTQGNWNGVIGKIQLYVTDQVWIDDIQVFPDVEAKAARVRVHVANLTGQPVTGTVRFRVTSVNTPVHQTITHEGAVFSIADAHRVVEDTISMGKDVLLWDEFHPALYQLIAEIETDGGMKSVDTVQFGMRSFEIAGTRFMVNGRPVFLRGDVDCAVFPETGYPPMDVPSWERLFKIRKAYGLNHVRFHSWCPPEAAFVAADRVGMYLQPEGPSWANHGTTLGDDRPVDQYIYQETNRMARYYGNYPSFCMMAYGNEPAGRHQVEYLNKFVDYWVEKDSRRVYTGASVGGSWPWVSHAQYIVKAYPRGVPVEEAPNTMFDHRSQLEGHDKPYVSHEVGQYCVYPDFKEIDRYTGVYKARNFELFQEDLADHGMADQAEDFLMASGKLQALFYKAEIEAALRTPGFAGFQLLQLNDFPGQGTALVGVLNAFFEEKGYIDSLAFRQFCNSTVPLARIPKFVYYQDEDFVTEVEIAHFGPKPLRNVTIAWKIVSEAGKVLVSGKFEQAEIPMGSNNPTATVSASLAAVTEATKCRFEVALEGTPFQNSWKFWVYPSALTMPHPEGLIVTGALKESVCTQLKAGARVLLLAAGKVEKGKEVAMYFKPVFWNTSWFKMRPPHTLGHWVMNQHPAFADFPTDYHSNYQWWELVHRQQVMRLDSFPAGFKPLIQPIDTWFLNRKLAALFEVQVGKGKLMVCSLDLLSDWSYRPVARQLYYSIVHYMQSDQFNPTTKVPLPLIQQLFEPDTAAGFNTYSKDSPDELKPKANQ